jgi:aminoglycoside phosphotransferase (APT) family kinase protein
VRVRSLHGGLSHATHRLDVVRDGRTSSVVLRRWARPRWRETDPSFTASHEAACLRLVEQAAIPAPRLLGVDADATMCDVPAVLQTFVRGAVPRRMDGATVDLLAATAARIHATPAAAARDVALPYEPYYELPCISVPDWLHDRELWNDALAAVAGDPPDGDACFLHRDLHPGNTLWHRGGLTGVLDWDRGSWGSPAVDVAHLCWNLAALYGLDLAERAATAYRRIGDRTLPDLAWWQVRNALDALPDVAAEWGTGRVDAMEAFVSAALRQIR